MDAWVPNHPSANLSVSRPTFDSVGPFKEDLPKDGVHEETEWQGRLILLGGRIRFEPRAAVWHRDRDAFKSYLKHNYGWGYNSIEVKSRAAVSRFSFLYQKPWALICGFFPFAVAHTLYTIVCWLRAGKFEPLFLTPVLFLGRLAYASGMTIGGIRSKQNRKKKDRGLYNAC
jgi:GT2 family glycosyltransferase